MTTLDSNTKMLLSLPFEEAGRRRKKIDVLLPFKIAASGVCSSKITRGDILSVSLNMALDGSFHVTFWKHGFFFLFFSDMFSD